MTNPTKKISSTVLLEDIYEGVIYGETVISNIGVHFDERWWEKCSVCIPQNTMLKLEENTKFSYSNRDRSYKSVKRGQDISIGKHGAQILPQPHQKSN